MVEEGGFDALSINKLAEAVDYTPGALYRYFGSKDALLSQLIERVLEEVRGHLVRAQALLPGKGDAARARARAGGRLSRLRQARAAPLRPARHEPGRAARPPRDEDAVAQPVMRRGDGGDAAARRRARRRRAAWAARRRRRRRAHDSASSRSCRACCRCASRRATRPGSSTWIGSRVQGTRALLLGWGAKPRAVDAAIDAGGAAGGPRSVGRRIMRSSSSPPSPARSPGACSST